MSGNLEEKTEEGDSKEAKFVSFGSHCLDPGLSDCYLFPGEPWTHFFQIQGASGFHKGAGWSRTESMANVPSSFPWA